ncbi:MAG: DNA mismatch repair protein MutH [Polyangiaceae bacterium]|nr:DNA mismatch repair protein MutH [Polyangiaceae bacterium]
MHPRPLPPTSPGELLARARALCGMEIGVLAAALGVAALGSAVRTKGMPGGIVERALGATGSGKVHDFPNLGIELKTIPVDDRGMPIESTYVCTLSLARADEQEWESSWVRAKLSRVLFVPLIAKQGASWRARRVASPLLWSPTKAQEDVLRNDFDEVVGLVGVGRIEQLTAHFGRWLQVRPKAAHGRIRTLAWGREGEAIATVPRGFYLRTRFTGALLGDPSAEPV